MITNEGGILIHTMSYTIINYSCESDVFNLITFFYYLCSTTVLYMKFLILWAIVMVADFMFMFRFEFLWPFWLLLRSVHDSFKYKGLVSAVGN